MARDEHRVAPAANAPEELAQPPDARRVEAVRRLVQDQDPRVAEQRARQPESLPHPERVLPGLAVPRRPTGPTSSSTSSTRSSAMPEAAASTRRWFRPVRSGWKLCVSSTAPTVRAGSSRLAVRHAQHRRRAGRSGPTSPRIIRSVVLLPAPLGPRNPVTRPGRTSNVRSSTAVTSPNRFVRPLTEIAGDPTRTHAPGAFGRSILPCWPASRSLLRSAFMAERTLGREGRRDVGRGYRSRVIPWEDARTIVLSRTRLRRRRVHEAGLVRQHDRLRPVAEAELLQHAADVGLHRRLRHEQLAGRSPGSTGREPCTRAPLARDRSVRRAPQAEVADRAAARTPRPAVRVTDGREQRVARRHHADRRDELLAAAGPSAGTRSRPPEAPGRRIRPGRTS